MSIQQKVHIPADGIDGLKQYYKEDGLSGFLVFLLALPLSLGIAGASDFPPIMGLITAMIGGVFVSVIAGSPLTIKGPAAGLIVIVAAAVADFGGNNPGLDILTEQLGQLFDFFRVDPDETSTSRAAIAALGAFEAEAVLVPRFGSALLGSAHRRLAPALKKTGSGCCTVRVAGHAPAVSWRFRESLRWSFVFVRRSSANRGSGAR